MNCHEFLQQYDLLLDHEAGRADLDPDLVETLRTHHYECALCQWEIRRDEALARGIRLLPTIDAPREAAEATAATGSRRGALLGATLRRRAAIAVVAAAATILGVVGIRQMTPREDPLPRLVALEAFRDGRWSEAEGELLQFGEALRSGPAATILPLSHDVSLEIDAHTSLAVRDREAIRLDEGLVSAWVRPGEPFRVTTPLADVVSKGTVFTVDVDSPGAGSNEMRMGAGDVAVAGVVTVAVATGSVTVMNSFGSVDLEPQRVARIEPGRAPILLAKAQGDSAMTRTMDDLRAELRLLRDRVEAQDAELAELRRAAELAPDAAEPMTLADPSELRDELDDLLAEFGYGAFLNPRFSQLAAELRALGAEGVAFLADAMRSADAEKRFAAASLAGSLGDPRVVPVLADLLFGDDELLVRRMSSHSLATMDSEVAVDVLAELWSQSPGPSDAGILLNSWYGLARLGRDVAFSSLSRLLDSATEELTENTMFGTILLVDDARLDSALEEAFYRTAVSSKHKLLILERIGAASGGASEFLWQVADDIYLDESLRRRAEELLR